MLQSVPNQFVGINAHLHSLWQSNGEWNTFHDYHIGQLMAALKAQLIPMGYTAKLTGSLQIRRVGDDLPRSPRSDVLIKDLDSARSFYPTLLARTPVLTMADLLAEAPEDLEHPYRALLIEEQGEAVAWLELLSPSNKGSSRDAQSYLAKRHLLLEQGLVFVELDYLHESPPTFNRLPDYSRHDSQAFPYRIVVIDPRPEYRENKVYLYQFGVEEPIPEADIPLNGGDVLTVDFDRLYQVTFESGLYGYEMDYAELPLHLERYSEADQLKILRRLFSVAKAKDFELPPVALIPELDSLQTALAQWEHR